jgi:Flp pilus assembly pilin Flp
MMKLRALARDQRGTSLIELGFLAPFLAVLTMGVIDLSRGLAERFAIQQAVNRSLELVQARPAVAADDATDVDYSYVRTEAAAAAGVPPSQVVLTRWLECDGGDPKIVTETCEDDEDVARYLRVRISKDFHGDFYYDTIHLHASGALRTQ